MHESVLELRVHGRVQGVGYRAALVAQARRLGVCGWVRNRRDGSVQAVLAGPGDAVQQLVQWARRGPPAAVVDGVGLQAADGEFSTFELRPTC